MYAFDMYVLRNGFHFELNFTILFKIGTEVNLILRHFLLSE